MCTYSWINASFAALSSRGDIRGSDRILARPPPELDLVDGSTIAAAAMAIEAASAMLIDAASLCGLMELSTLTHSASLALPRGSPASTLQQESEDSNTPGGPDGVSPAFEESMFHKDCAIDSAMAAARDCALG